LAEESGDTYSQGLAYGGHGYSCFAKGYLDEAEKYLLKSVEFCERIRHHAWKGASSMALGDLYWEKKNFTKSKEYFEKGFQCYDGLRATPSIANLAKIGLTRTKVMDNEKDINLETLFTYSTKNRMVAYEGFNKKWISDLLNQMDGQYLPAAECWINQAIEADRRNGTNLNLARNYLSYADLLTRKGDRQKAVENLGKAIETFKECGADGWVEKAEKDLALLS
jgi:tetratricopeptide (TPR) repeat protein